MNCLERLIKAHNPVGIYNIKDGGNIYSELSVYAQELERLQKALEDALCESFVPVAKGEGLAAVERIWGSVRADLPLEKRRSMALTRYALCEEDFTAQTAQKLLKAVGISGEICEYPKLFRITVEVKGSESLAKRKWIRAQLRSLFPAHLEVDPVFEGFDWKTAESVGLTFEQIEEKAVCWDDADIFCL